MPVAGEPLQCAGIGKQLAFACIECGAFAQILDIAERQICSRLFDAFTGMDSESVDFTQSQSQDRRTAFERRIPVAMTHIDWVDLCPMTLEVLHDLAGRIKSQWLRIEQRGSKRGRLVALEPSAGVGEQGETRG